MSTKEASETSNSGDDLSPEYFEECHEVTEEDPEVVVGVPDSDTRDNFESSHSDCDSYSQSTDSVASSVESMDTSKYSM